MADEEEEVEETEEVEEISSEALDVPETADLALDVAEEAIEVAYATKDDIDAINARLDALMTPTPKPASEESVPDTLDEIVAEETVPIETESPKPRHWFYR